MKKVKDPIYGYIEFDEAYWAYLIDKPEFQRLRHISQTGYQALFPSAHHNRFVHSLGVAHLGMIGFSSFRENVQGSEPDVKWNRLRNTFILACLLHDVGHSPFSHAGEDFYEDALTEEGISSRLKAIAASQEFSDDLDVGNYGKPHEAMSAIIGVPLCLNTPMISEEVDSEEGIYAFDTELFVRAIIGLKYKNGNKHIENALISLLNGEYIDVDKLDYIMRDAFTTGYNSLLIDYERLLSGYTLVEDEEGNRIPGFHRKAISVIENVVYAKDLERRWVQKDPTILYDCRIIEYMIKEFVEHSKTVFEPSGVFVPEALTTKGICSIRSGRRSRAWLRRQQMKRGNPSSRIKLLCDDDIVAYAKNEGTSEAARQFFDRASRLKPLWKTELEYWSNRDRVLSDTGRMLWQRALGILAKELRNNSALAIDFEFVVRLENDVSLLKEKIAPAKEDAKRRLLEKMLQSKELSLSFCILLREFIKETNSGMDGELEFRFYVIESSGFSPDYDFEKFKTIQIDMGHGHSCSLGESVGIEKKVIKNSESEKCYFLYTTAQNKRLRSDLAVRFWDYMRQNLEGVLRK